MYLQWITNNFMIYLFIYWLIDWLHTVEHPDRKYFYYMNNNTKSYWSCLLALVVQLCLKHRSKASKLRLTIISSNRITDMIQMGLNQKLT